MSHKVYVGICPGCGTVNVRPQGDGVFYYTNPLQIDCCDCGCKTQVERLACQWKDAPSPEDTEPWDCMFRNWSLGTFSGKSTHRSGRFRTPRNKILPST